MKQEMISYLSTIEDEIFSLMEYIYKNPEESFKEYKCYNYIINLLKKHNFKLKENYLNIPTSFYAEIGNTYPKIAFICEYDGDIERGHIFGHNCVTAMSIGAALCLSKIIPKTKGTIVVLGCPGEYIKGSKNVMVKEGTFKDINAVLMANPHTTTMETTKSFASLPLKINFNLREESLGAKACVPYDCSLLLDNYINILNKSLPYHCSVTNIIENSFCNPYYNVGKSEKCIMISAETLEICNKIRKIIEDITLNLSNSLNINREVSLYSFPIENIKINSTLSRLFWHNLKEAGIINKQEANINETSLSMGSISKVVPCIYPYISITENPRIIYGTKNFAKETMSDYSKENILKTIQALACTAFDLIDNESLLQELNCNI